MAKKVSQYTTQATVLAAGDLIDLTKLISTGPNVYESQKADANLLAGWNLFGQDQTMPAPRLHNLGNNQLSLTNGRLLLKGSDNIATDLLKLESLAGTEVFKAQNDGTIKISNAFTLPTSDGTTGQALLTNGSGAVSFGSVALNNIYTSNGSLTNARILDLDGNNFDIVDTGVTNTASFRINSGSGAVVDRNSVASTFVCRANSVNHTEFGPVTTYIAGTNIQLGSNTNDNGLQIETDRVRYYTNEIGTGGVPAGQIHDIHADYFLIYKRGFERPYNSYFAIGSASQVGTEDISLQGNTLISEKLELSSTNHGILLNRVNNSEMSAISADTNEIVFNDEVNALYRWDGSAWVALSAGYGIIEVVTNSDNGTPKFYADLQSALENCKASGSNNIVNLHSDINLTSQIEINYSGTGLGNGYQFESLSFNFNGFEVSNTQADSTRCFNINLNTNASNNQKLSFLGGGTIRRVNGTTTALKITGVGILSMNKYLVYSSSSPSALISLNTSDSDEMAVVNNLGGTTFIGSPVTTTSYALDIRDCIATDFNAISENSNFALRVRDAKAFNFTVKNNSTGGGIFIYGTNESIYNFEVKTLSGVGVNNQGADYIYDFRIDSGSGIALESNNETDIYNGFCTSSSSSWTSFLLDTKILKNVSFVNTGNGYPLAYRMDNTITNSICENITCISNNNYAFNANSNGGKVVISDSNFISDYDNVGGHGIFVRNSTTLIEIKNCNIQVLNSGANCIIGHSSETATIVNSVLKGATTPINANITVASSTDLGNGNTKL